MSFNPGLEKKFKGMFGNKRLDRKLRLFQETGSSNVLDNSDDEAEDDNPSPPPSRSPKKKLVFVRSINWLTFFSPVLRARVTQAVSDTDNKDHDGTASKPGGRYMVASSRSSKNR